MILLGGRFTNGIEGVLSYWEVVVLAWMCKQNMTSLVERAMNLDDGLERIMSAVVC